MLSWPSRGRPGPPKSFIFLRFLSIFDVGPSWLQLRASSSILGHLGPSWGHLGALLGPFQGTSLLSPLARSRLAAILKPRLPRTLHMPCARRTSRSLNPLAIPTALHPLLCHLCPACHRDTKMEYLLKKCSLFLGVVGCVNCVGCVPLIP